MLLETSEINQWIPSLISSHARLFISLYVSYIPPLIIHTPFHNKPISPPRYPGGMPVPCGVGQYSLLGESYCRACPRGHACAAVDAAPVPCTNGTFSLGNATSCVDAPKGFYSAITTEQPIRCPRGYTATSTKSRLCARCPAGYECPSADVSVYWFWVYLFIGLYEGT